VSLPFRRSFCACYGRDNITLRIYLFSFQRTKEMRSVAAPWIKATIRIKMVNYTCVLSRAKIIETLPSSVY